MGVPLYPWQQEVVIRALELLPNGRYRFKTVLIIVARQNGKSFLSQVIALYKMYVDGAMNVLGTAQNLRIAREVWQGAVKFIDAIPDLRAQKAGVRKTNGEQELELTNGARYLICATNDDAGRGMTIDHLTLDEIRQHKNSDAWNALAPTTRKPRKGQIWAISNAGDAQSVVLNDLRAKAIAGSSSIALFEWSAEENCQLDNREGWKAANPALGYMFPISEIEDALEGMKQNGFRTEVLCQSVENLHTAVDLNAWDDQADDKGTMDGLRNKIVLCLDIAPDGNHATLVAAAQTDDGRIRLESVAAWDSTEEVRAKLPAFMDKIKPIAFAWFPTGPAAALATELRQYDGVELIGAKVNEACQGFSELISSRRIIHPDDPLLNAHVKGARRYYKGETGWSFVRKDAGHVDAAYAAAGAIYALQTREEPEAQPNWLIY